MPGRFQLDGQAREGERKGWPKIWRTWKTWQKGKGPDLAKGGEVNRGKKEVPVRVELMEHMEPDMLHGASDEPKNVTGGG